MRNIHDKNHDVAMTKTIETCQSQFSHETMHADEKHISSQPSRASQSRRNIATATTTMLESSSLSMTIDFIQCPDGLSLRGRLSPDATADTRRGLDEHGEIVDSMRTIRPAAIASNAVAMSATDGEVRIRAFRLPGHCHLRAAASVAEIIGTGSLLQVGPSCECGPWQCPHEVAVARHAYGLAPVMDATERFRDKLRATFNSFDSGNKRNPTTASAHDSCRTIFPTFKQRHHISPIFPVGNTSALNRT